MKIDVVLKKNLLREYSFRTTRNKSLDACITSRMRQASLLPD